MARAAPPSGSQIAADASKYAGLGYVYGGDASSPGNWDCSSFVSYVLGHDFNLGLPGNGRFGEPGYPPTSHGPVVVDYANWNGARTVAGPPQAGDLCCFVGLGAGQSYLGGGDTFGLSGEMLQPGEFVTAVWAGGHPGDTATLRVTGDQVVMVY